MSESYSTGEDVEDILKRKMSEDPRYACVKSYKKVKSFFDISLNLYANFELNPESKPK